MPKKGTKKEGPLGRRRLVVLVVICLLALVLTYGVTVRVLWSRAAVAEERAGVNTLATLIVRAANGLKVEAPIDPKTGDIYFPQAKLFVPSSGSPTRLSYEYKPYGTDGPMLSVSSPSLFSRRATQLYAAQTTKELFDAVPKLQSCQRGVTVSYNQLSADNASGQNLQVVTLSTGKRLYLYSEKQCPELQPTIELLQRIRAY